MSDRIVSSRPPEKAIIPPGEARLAVWPVYVRSTTPTDGIDGTTDGNGTNAGTLSAASPGAIPEPAATAETLAEASAAPIEATVAVATAIVEADQAAASSNGAARTTPEIDRNAERFRKRTPGIVLDCGATNTVRHVGVIFVHGIGSQAAGDTLREWSGSIIRVLSGFRIDEHVPADPVVTTQLDPSSGKTLFIEVELPEVMGQDEKPRIPAEHWVLTEAWWAQRVAPPPFAQMAQWLGPGGAVRRIVTAMFAAQGSRNPRQRPASEAHPLERIAIATDHGDEPDVHQTAESTERLSMLTRPIEDPTPPPDDRMISGPRGIRAGSPLRPGPVVGLLEKLGVGLFLQAVSALVLLLYGFLRSIEKILPIGPLKDGALTRPIDNFILDWFGDVYVLLGDPAQSASVRSRLVDAIWDLEAIDCQPISIVAHSGGAIVTYQTLADPVTRKLRVDRVLTIGEAANLGWRLTDAGDVGAALRKAHVGAADVYGDLYRSIDDRRHKVLWTDFWASQDPAPVGTMSFPHVRLPKVESIGVWNRLSFTGDHGAYWDNDEEFVIPLLRRLFGSARGHAMRRFGGDADHERRSGRRRQRVGVLSFWSQFCRALPTLVVVHAFAVGAGTVFAAGELATSIWNMVPGHEIISGPVEQLRTALPNGFPAGTVGDWIAQLGVWVIAAVLASSAIFALRAPPERSALFVSPWRAIDVIYAVALRALVLYLVVLAMFAFVNPPEQMRPNALTLVAAVIVLAVIEVALVQVFSRDPGDTRKGLTDVASRIRSGIGDLWRSTLTATGLSSAVPTAAVAIALGISLLLVGAPFLAMALFPKTANLVLGTIVIFVAFQLLQAVGTWRWTAWDNRERVETQKRNYRGSRNFAVAVQMTIHTAAAVLLYEGIVHSDLALLSMPLIVLAILFAASAIVIGVGIDVTSATRRRVETDDRVGEMMRMR